MKFGITRNAFSGRSEIRFLGQIALVFHAFRCSGRTSGFSDRKTPAGQHQIGEAEQDTSRRIAGPCFDGGIVDEKLFVFLAFDRQRACKGGTVNRGKHRTTQMSFSSKWAGRPVRAAATSSASAWSSRLRINHDSAMRTHFAHGPGHPTGQ